MMNCFFIMNIYTHGNLLANSIGLSLLHLGRDFFLLPIKLNGDKGCNSLQTKVDNIKKKMGVNIPIKVATSDLFSWCAHGSVVYGKGCITVPTLETWANSPADIQNAILAHEIAHLKHNDGAWLFVIGLVTLVASTVFMRRVFPVAIVPFTGYLGQIPCLAAIFIRAVYQERAADREASKYTTKDQKRAFADLSEKMRLSNLEYRNAEGLSWLTQLWRKCKIDNEGNSFLERLTHPPLTERIQYFREQIKR